MADVKIDLSQFGKDHWSTLAYCAAMFYSEKGIGKQHMRCNPERHPHFAHTGGWKDSYSTRLRGGGQALGHDDWDCLWDLENYGFIGVLTGRAEIFWLTAKGNRAARELIEHKRAGGNFATFVPSEIPATADNPLPEVVNA